MPVKGWSGQSDEYYIMLTVGSSEPITRANQQRGNAEADHLKFFTISQQSILFSSP